MAILYPSFRKLIALSMVTPLLASRTSNSLFVVSIMSTLANLIPTFLVTLRAKDVIFSFRLLSISTDAILPVDKLK